ncbi:MAG: DUF357 domain-containing protein [Candidatus Thermoplasmatota archaeon]|nr:DUF357 domain-containing protein [Candidatus Thermoplasmatota archaeon]
MDELARELTEQTATWRKRLDRALEEAEPATAQGADLMVNVRAYRQDADHFEQEGDLVRAFEAIVWAWSWLEIGARLEEIDWSYPESWD